MIMLCWQTVHF